MQNLNLILQRHLLVSKGYFTVLNLSHDNKNVTKDFQRKPKTCDSSIYWIFKHLVTVCPLGRGLQVKCTAVPRYTSVTLKTDNIQNSKTMHHRTFNDCDYTYYLQKDQFRSQRKHAFPFKIHLKTVYTCNPIIRINAGNVRFCKPRTC